jgi:cytolysin-activating lysine-acyltransferase
MGENSGPRDVRLALLSTPLSPTDKALVLSGVLYLAGYSELHASYGLVRLYARIRPALKLGQFVFCTDATGAPAAFCNWAWLSDDVLTEVLATGRDLHADEFACGELPLLYEFLAPFGHFRAMARAVRDRPEFRGLTIPALRAAKGGAPRPSAKIGRFSF